MKRVTIFKNGSRKDGKVILVKDTIEQLVQDVCEKLKLESLERVQLYTSSGALIDEVGAMKDDEVLFVSTNDEPFIPPPETMNIKNEWITLNVGGRKFTTTRSTLTKNQPDSMLARMFSNDLNDGMTPSPVDESGAFLIDRSPIYFEPIIGYLRHGQLVLDEGVNIRGVLEEARFYGLETLVQVIEDLIEQETDREAKSMCLSRRDVINALIGTTCNAELRFQGVNLSGADLSKLDLRNINFKYANFKGANLSGANLSYCCLERADLSDCNLDGAILHGVKMVCANLEGSSLRGINCEDPMNKVTNMEGINLKVSWVVDMRFNLKQCVICFRFRQPTWMEVNWLESI